METMMNAIGSNYESTLPIVCTENLVMGLTLLLIVLFKRVSNAHFRVGITYFALAMVMVGLLNLLEYHWGSQLFAGDGSFALVVFAASVQQLLFVCAFVSMLNPSHFTQQRIALELFQILLFTVPVLFVSSTQHPLVFNLLFLLALSFYIVKLLLNVRLYKRSLRKVASDIESYYSSDSSQLLDWISRTFYVVIAVGLISVVVPVTNLAILTLYNVFVFIAYLYIYIQIILNIYQFDSSMARVDGEGVLEVAVEGELHSERRSSGHPLAANGVEPNEKQLGSFLLGREKVFESWLAEKAYCNSGITADDIAAQLNTNRNRLSVFLKTEQNMSYYEWIAYLRIEEAKRLLTEHPELPIYEIAFRVGIDDKSNFGRVFKRFEGVSPAVYRQSRLFPSRGEVEAAEDAAVVRRWKKRI